MFLVYIERVKQAHAGGLAGVGVAIQTLYRSWGWPCVATAMQRPTPCDMAQGRCDKHANARDMAQGRCDKRGISRDTARGKSRDTARGKSHDTARDRDLCRDTILCHD